MHSGWRYVCALIHTLVFMSRSRVYISSVHFITISIRNDRIFIYTQHAIICQLTKPLLLSDTTSSYCSSPDLSGWWRNSLCRYRTHHVCSLVKPPTLSLPAMGATRPGVRQTGLRCRYRKCRVSHRLRASKLFIRIRACIFYLTAPTES